MCINKALHPSYNFRVANQWTIILLTTLATTKAIVQGLLACNSEYGFIKAHLLLCASLITFALTSAQTSCDLFSA